MILLTGFEPFGGDTANSSWSAVSKALPILHAGGVAAEAVQLPCVFGKSAAVLREALERYQPSLVVCVGQAGGRGRVSLERVAINCDDARIPDNAGNRPVDEEVVPGGPAAYFSSLPLKSALKALMVAGIPAEVSQTAGTYVCNHIFYSLMHLLETATPSVRGGFVHVPYEPHQLPQGSNVPSLPSEVAAEALAVVVREVLASREDIRLAAGATH